MDSFKSGLEKGLERGDLIQDQGGCRDHDRLSFDVLVIGSGPAGLAAASSAAKGGGRSCIIEREERAGGILKQCIHDGFGVIRYAERLTGPEYACREIEAARAAGVRFLLATYILSIEKREGGFLVKGVNRSGLIKLSARALVLATGCRERTGRQIFLQGSRPAGVYTAGLAQYFINIQGYLPGRRSVILGSGDIGLIMARRLSLEGAEVEGVYEIQPSPSGLPRNIAQCLEDYSIPLHLSTTVIRVHGKERLEGVTVASVDETMKPVNGTERFIPCDTLLLSVGLIPENELARTLGIRIDPATGGPVVDSGMMSSLAGVFSCGNALHVSDLADYVSLTGEIAGVRAARFANWVQDSTPVDQEKGSSGSLPGSLPGGAPDAFQKDTLSLQAAEPFSYILPQRILITDLLSGNPVSLYFRVKKDFDSCRMRIFVHGSGKESPSRVELAARSYPYLRPAEMESFELSLSPEMAADLESGFTSKQFNALSAEVE